MKHLSVLIVLLIVCSSSQTLWAQTTDSWVTIPLGEQFTIQMPKSHAVNPMKRSFENFSLGGNVYTATEDGVDYTVWSFVNEGKVSNDPTENEAYLDACADLVWESLLKPLRDQLPKDRPVRAFMAYQRELETIKPLRGREYAVTLENRTGLIHFYVAGPRIYVLRVLDPQGNFTATQRFLNYIGPRTGLPGSSSMQGAGLGPPYDGMGTGIGIGSGSATSAPAPTDYNRTFTGRDVTQKARVLAKPEPQYTESARKYAVQGTVVLRAVFSNSGQVTNIRVVRRLPHGLTDAAIAAAGQIRFTPALKDQHEVSMYIQLEYNFNLY